MRFTIPDGLPPYSKNRRDARQTRNSQLDIWNLATPDIEGCFDIEAFNIEGCFDIEYTTFNIEVFALISKLTKNLRYRRNFDIKG
jgi:hypothetical protein